MRRFDRRQFLSALSGSLTACAALPLLEAGGARAASPIQAPTYGQAPAGGPSCWLEVCAPFVVESEAGGVHTEIILTSDTFAGPRGYADGRDATDYEIYLYDAAGKPIGAGGVAKRMTVPAMQTTVIAARELVGGAREFWGGMKIRLRPRGRGPLHASDLFSSAFVRWTTDSSFDNVHANPDPLQWQKAEGFYYSMPFPALADYECAYSLFNPYDAPGAGKLALHDWRGRELKTLRYELKPHASLLLRLDTGELTGGACSSFRPGGEAADPALTRGGGMIVVTNDDRTRKSFGYLLIKRRGAGRFSVEHPIHQGAYKPETRVEAFDAGAKFKARNVLYSPLVFRAKRVGQVTLESRFHFGTGLLLPGEAQWLYPLVTDAAGEVAWSSMADPKLSRSAIHASQLERGVIRLGPRQACLLDPAQLSFPDRFSGGLALAVTPEINHTLMKVELRVPEWGAHAFTHFRPGLRAARAYQRVPERGGLATDYITAGARLERRAGELLFDELVAVMNIDDVGGDASPALELFDARGLVARVPLGKIPAFACRHFLLSELIPPPGGGAHNATMTLRLTDERATLLMSSVHLDYARRDLALDHGSDRFSTFADYGCA